jgi:DNA-binding MarR family transcriptional regulator
MAKVGDAAKDGVDIIVDEWGKADLGIDLGLLELSSRITRLDLFLERNAEAICREYGFGFGEADLLMTLRRVGPPYTLRPTDLSQASLVTSGATTGRIDRLAALGLVDRVSSTTDRRAAYVHLTRQGWDVTEELLQRLILNSPLHAAGPFTETERAITISVLRRIAQGLGDEQPSSESPPAASHDWQKDAGKRRRIGKR